MALPLTVRLAGLAALACAAGCVRERPPPPPGVLTVSVEQESAWVRNFNPLTSAAVPRWPTWAGIYEPLYVWSGVRGEHVPWLATGHTGADFPILSVAGAYGVSLKAVVAQSNNLPTAFVWWQCLSYYVSDCDASADWTVGSFDPPNTVNQPMVVVSSNGDVFVLWENQDTGDIGIATWCAGESGFTTLGVVDHLTNYTDPVDYVWGQAAGSPVETVDWDPKTDTLHAAFLARQDDETEGRNDVLHWWAEYDELCP